MYYKYDWVLLLNVQSEVVSRKSDAMLIYVSRNNPFSKNKYGSYPWMNILHAWLKICRKSLILQIRLPNIQNNRNRNVKYKSLQNFVFKLAYPTSEKN